MSGRDRSRPFLARLTRFREIAVYLDGPRPALPGHRPLPGGSPLLSATCGPPSHEFLSVAIARIISVDWPARIVAGILRAARGESLLRPREIPTTM